MNFVKDSWGDRDGGEGQQLFVAPRVHDQKVEETNRVDRMAMFLLEEIDIYTETAEHGMGSWPGSGTSC